MFEMVLFFSLCCTLQSLCLAGADREIPSKVYAYVPHLAFCLYLSALPVYPFPDLASSSHALTRSFPPPPLIRLQMRSCLQSSPSKKLSKLDPPYAIKTQQVVKDKVNLQVCPMPLALILPLSHP